MANAQNANTFWVDSTGVLSTRPTLVLHIIATASGTSAELLLVDPVSSGDVNKVKITIPASGDTKEVELTENDPIRFPNGVKVATATNVEATIVYREVGSGQRG